MANPFKAIWNFFKKLYTRPGMQAFLEKYIDDAVMLVGQLMTKHNNAEFKMWADEAFALAKERYGELRGTWITILINLAYENLKAGSGKKM
jgi:hypothetical protein